MRTYGYIRVSSEDQALQGVSLEAQRAQVEAMALLKGVTVTEIIEDAGESAKSLKRPGIQRLIELIQSKQVDMLICYKFDRVSRDMRDSLFLMDLLKKSRVELICIADVKHDLGTAFGRLMSGMSMLLSEFERGQISERTAGALQFIKRSGCPVGPAPYGWTSQDRPKGADNKRQRMPLIENVAEQHTIKVIMDQHSRGDSYREIAAALNAAGYRTRKGGEWIFTGVARIVKDNRSAA